jgi:hypothetical protein
VPRSLVTLTVIVDSTPLARPVKAQEVSATHLPPGLAVTVAYRILAPFGSGSFRPVGDLERRRERVHPGELVALVVLDVIPHPGRR